MVAPCCVLLVSRWLTHLSGAELWRAGRSGLLLPTLLPSPSSPFKCPFNNPRWGADISPCSRSVQPQSTRRAQVGSGGVSVRYADGGAHTWLFAGHTPYDDWGLLCRDVGADKEALVRACIATTTRYQSMVPNEQYPSLPKS